MGEVIMGAKEQLRLDVVTKVIAGQLTREQAKQVLDVSDRTVGRYVGNYRRRGILFVKHGNFERTPANKISLDIKKQAMLLVREKYFDFNMSHCLEKLVGEEEIHVKRETFRKWCHEIGMVKRAKRRRAKARYRRERMQQTGLMIQMDGAALP